MNTDRHSKIIEIVQKYEIETQDELIEKLKAYGFETTQATISRDIKKLNLIKVQSQKTGKYIYTPVQNDSKSTDSKYMTLLKETVISAKNAENIVVIKTYPGMANAAGAAIDNIANDLIIGSIAGDDTIFVVVSNDENAEKFAIQLSKIIQK